MWHRLREPLREMWVNFADGPKGLFSLITDEEPPRTVKLVRLGEGRWGGEPPDKESGKPLPPIPFEDPPLDAAIEERFRAEMAAVDIRRVFRCPQCHGKLRCAKCEAEVAEWRGRGLGTAARPG